MTHSSKQTLRSTCKSARLNRTSEETMAASEHISTLILAWRPFLKANSIALYQAIKGEIDLSILWKSAIESKKACYFPAINEDQTLSFLPATPSTPLTKNRFGIAEPNIERSQALLPAQIDIIFLPLVAFDEHGTRLGMGAGYYDRTLAHARPPLLVGVAYEAQRQPFIEADAWDVPMDVVVTERSIYWSKPCPTIG